MKDFEPLPLIQQFKTSNSQDEKISPLLVIALQTMPLPELLACSERV